MFWLRWIARIVTCAFLIVREVRGLVSDLSSPKPPITSKPSKKAIPQMINITPKEAKAPVQDLVQMQIDMEKMFHKNQLIPRIRKFFEESDIPFAQGAIEAKLDIDFCYSLLIQMSLHKRANISTLVGLLRRYFKKEVNSAQCCADAILKAAEADFVDYDPLSRLFIVKWDITPEVQAELDTFQFPLPMIVPPNKLEGNINCGYYTVKESALLKDNHHDGYICHQHLNKMNQIPLRINGKTALLVRNKWKNLDRMKEDESIADFKKRLKAFDKYNRSAHDVHAHLEIAGGTFYLVHSFDKRGRTYPKGYHVSYQGNGWNKAVIQFADEEVTE